MKPQLLFTFALGLATLAGCVSAEDEANAKRRVELESEQAALIGDAADCGKVFKDLDEWYLANKDEVDRLDAWMDETSEWEEKRMMEPYQADRKANLKVRLMGTIKCGFVPWNGRRAPEKK